MRTSTRTRRTPGTIALAIALAGGLAACGGSESDSASSGSSPAGDSGTSSPGGGSGEGVTVQAAQFSWTAAALTNAILAQIAEQEPELGVAEIETTQLDPATAWTGMQRGDLDLITEVALPNQQDLVDQAAEQATVVSETYGDANQGWFVPSYVVEEGGPAEGLTSVTDLNEYSEVFDNKFYDADPGYITTEQNRARLDGYGVDFEHVVAGEAAQLAQLERAIDREEPIVLYLYRPHAVHAQYDLTQLEEPNPYEEGCFTEGDGACAMPAYSANIAVSNELQEQAPAFVDMLEQFSIPLEEMEEMQAAVDVEGEDAETVAEEWVETNAEAIEQWTQATG